MGRRKKCQHCRERGVNRPRGLCWRCYFQPGVKEQYSGVGGKFSRRGVAHFGGPLPAPTRALPGSPEKVAELERRAAAGLALWHPLDGLEQTDERNRNAG